MSNGIVIPIDGDTSKIDAKLQRVKRNSAAVGNAAGKAIAQGGSVAARMGGAGGGIAGRALGGFGLGMGAGFAGVGLAGAGMLLSRSMNVEAANTARAQAGVQRSHAAEDMMRRISSKRDALAAGGLSFSGKIARSAYRKEGVAGLGERGAEFGLTPDQMLDVNDASMPGASSDDIAKGLSTGVLGGSATEVAKKIKRAGGLFKALAVETKVSPKQAESDYASFRSNPIAQNALAANAASGASQQMQINDLATGRTTAAVRASESDKMNPEKKEREEAYKSARRVADLLAAAAKEQSWFSEFMQTMRGETSKQTEWHRAESEAGKLSNFSPGATAD